MDSPVHEPAGEVVAVSHLSLPPAARSFVPPLGFTGKLYSTSGKHTLALAPDSTSGMTTLTKLRDALGSVIATAAHSYREIDSELTTAALSRREAVAQLMAATLTGKSGASWMSPFLFPPMCNSGTLVSQEK